MTVQVEARINHAQAAAAAYRLRPPVALLILLILILEIAEKRLAIFELIQRKFKFKKAQ